MTTKYKNKNALILWWENASKNARIGAVVGGAIVGLIILGALGFGVKQLFTVDAEQKGQAQTTVEIPVKGVDPSDIPSAFPTPELPPIDLPPTPTPTPSASASTFDENETRTDNPYAQGSEGSFNRTDSTGFDGSPSDNPNVTQADYTQILRNVGRTCSEAELGTAPSGGTLLKATHSVSSNEFSQITPCLEAMVTESKNSGADVEVVVKNGQTELGYMLLRTSDVDAIAALNNQARTEEFKKAFQVHPKATVKY